MIFVTVGTHEQQFNRLIEYVDRMKQNSEFAEEVVVQTGFSTYDPVHCRYEKFFSYQEMQRAVQSARIVITHGGPSSFVLPLQYGKIPIVVPRQKQYKEHVNDHQIDFCKAVSERFGNIIVANDNTELKNAILHYDSIIAAMPKELNSNNDRFNQQFEKMVEEMFGGI